MARSQRTTKSKRTIQIQVSLTSKNAERALKQLIRTNKRGMRQIGRSVESTFGPFKRLKDSIVAVNQGLQLGGRIYRAFGSALGHTSGLALRQSEIFAQLGASLAHHNIEWGDARDRVVEFADEIQATTRVGDDATAQILRQVSSMTRGMEMSLDDLLGMTETVIDITQSMEVSVDTVSRALARVRAGEFTAMSRLLPGMDSQLRALKDSGADGAEGIALIAEAFRGAASDGDQLAIDLARVSNAGGDVLEAIGGIFNQALRSSGAVGELADEVDSLAVQIADADSTIGTFVRDAMSGLIVFAEVGFTAITRVAQGFTFLRDAARAARDDLTLAMLTREQRNRLQNLEDIQNNLEVTGALVSDATIRSLRRQGFEGGPAIGAEALGRGMQLSNEELSEMGIDPLEASRSQAAAFEAIQRQRDLIMGGFSDAIQPALDEANASQESLVQNAQAWENAIDRAGSALQRLRDGLRQDFETGALDPRGGGGGGLGAGGAGAGGGGGGDLGAMAAFLGLPGMGALVRPRPQGLGVLLGARGMAQDLLGLGLGQGGKTFEDGKEAPLSLFDEAIETSASTWSSSVSSMAQDWGSFITGVEGGTAKMMDSFKGTVASTLGSIGSSITGSVGEALLTGAAFGPLAPLALLGVAASLAAGAIGGLGGAGGSGINSAVDVQAPDIMAANQAAFAPTPQTSHFHLHTGAIFTGDQGNEWYGKRVRETQDLGHLASTAAVPYG